MGVKKFFSSLPKLTADPTQDYVVGIKANPDGTFDDVLFPAVNETAIFKTTKLFSDFGGGAVNFVDLIVGALPPKCVPEIGAIVMNSEWLTPGISAVTAALFVQDPNSDFNLDHDAGDKQPRIGTANISGINGPNAGGMFDAMFNINNANAGIFNYVYNRTSPLNIILRLAVDTAFGQEDNNLSATGQVTNITTVADVAGSLGGKYWNIELYGSRYYVWYDTGASVDPAPPGRVSMRVAINVGDSANTVAYKTATTIKNAGVSDLFQYNNLIRTQDITGGGSAAGVDVNSGFTITNLTLSGSPAIKQVKDLTQGSLTAYLKYSTFN